MPAVGSNCFGSKHPPELLEDIDTSSDDSLLDDPFFDEFSEMNQCIVMALNIFWTLSLTLLVMYFSLPQTQTDPFGY